ncbi:MAG: PqqD family protein [Thermoanaerobaculia bacterium]|nr:MAG: PqqD family protein [Thermoanaerobaculia bacterium]MBZ0103254.1 PqqD family protein [Thermoanaerobaculia bacterium]
MTGASNPLPQRLRRVDHLAQRRVGEETIVVDLRQSRVYGFNPAGGELLDALRAGRDTAELAAWAAESGGADLGLFLAELLAAGLVDAGEPADGAEAAPALAGHPSGAPRLLWREEVARVTHQTSPPQAITNPQCQP